MANREFMEKFKTFNYKRHGVGGWYLFEKYDGQLGFWDGGVTRGLLKTDVPWANHAKDGRYIKPQVCTGLWSGYANVIHAPDDWLDQLPKTPMVGELWNGDRTIAGRQRLMSTIRTIEPGLWTDVKYYIFNLPHFDEVFREGQIRNPNYTKYITREMHEFMRELSINIDWMMSAFAPYRIVAMKLKAFENDVVIPVPYEMLPMQTTLAFKRIDERMQEVNALMGEGLIVRNPGKCFEVRRVDHVLKIKQVQDAEGIVIGYITGRRTDKGSKLLGLMGALVVDFNGNRLELSGFTDSERVLMYDGVGESAYDWAAENPETLCPVSIHNPLFPRGSQVTFRYRELSRDGIPQEARYWRVRRD
jgi:hypothetical protein